MAGKPTKKRAVKKTAKKRTVKKKTTKPSQPVTVGPIAKERPKPAKIKGVAASKRGRPAGSKTQNSSGKSTPSRCPKCSSTERTPYSQTREIEVRGEDPEFGSYTHVIRRWTRCKGCGQARTDRSLAFKKSAA